MEKCNKCSKQLEDSETIFLHKPLNQLDPDYYYCVECLEIQNQECLPKEKKDE